MATSPRPVWQVGFTPREGRDSALGRKHVPGERPGPGRSMPGPLHPCLPALGRSGPGRELSPWPWSWFCSPTCQPWLLCTPCCLSLCAQESNLSLSGDSCKYTSCLIPLGEPSACLSICPAQAGQGFCSEIMWQEHDKAHRGSPRAQRPKFTWDLGRLNWSLGKDQTS